jgi:hypothetical protein
MHDFKYWLWKKELSDLVMNLLSLCHVEGEFNEALQLTLPNDREIAHERLKNHLKNMNLSANYTNLISVMRHIFTTYDTEWKDYDKLVMKSEKDYINNPLNPPPIPVTFIHPVTHEETSFDFSDKCDQLIYWNTLVTAVHQLVEHIIEKIIKNHPQAYYEPNKQWLKLKLKPIPASCQIN